MNITLYRSAPHPPDTSDQQVLHIPAADELRRLALADRLSLRFGIWLLRRAQRPRTARHLPAGRPERDPFDVAERQRSAAEAYALLTYDLQRQMR